MGRSNLKKQKNKAKIQPVFDNGLKFVCKTFVAFVMNSENSSFACTIIASKKVGNAVKRNLCKRRLREVVRLFIKPQLKISNIILLARKNTAIENFDVIVRDVNYLIRKTNTLSNAEAQTASE